MTVIGELLLGNKPIMKIKGRQEMRVDQVTIDSGFTPDCTFLNVIV